MNADELRAIQAPKETERYCVVYQTLKNAPPMSVTRKAA